MTAMRGMWVAWLLGWAGLAAAQDVRRFGDVRICAVCHLELPPPEAAKLEDRSVGPSAMWPGSMMAHSARDPYWKAKVSSETANLPGLAEIIEDTCLSCHAPMQQYDQRVKGNRLRMDELGRVGEQGVGCTVCHQITSKGLGTKASFEARFEVNSRRENYGPHANPFAHPMVMHSGYTPVESAHVAESELCATCHTVITPMVDAKGQVVGEFVEQAPYLEWLASDYSDMGMTCQNCHLPALADANGRVLEQYIAHNPRRFPFPPTKPRKPFARHVLAGGNVTVLEAMKSLYPGEVEILSEKQRHTHELLSEAVSLGLKEVRAGERREVAVSVSNHAGHKLPSGFPSRRIWLHFTARDAVGKVIFESGAWDPASGEIHGLDGLEPHHSRVRRPGQVMIYEAEMADTEGNVTSSLLQGAHYARDNRLLPSGFDLGKLLPDGIEPGSIAPAGIDGDSGFEPGGHTVIHELPAADFQAPLTVSVEALFQTIKPAHAGALALGRSAAEREFTKLLSGANSPVVLGRQEIQVGGK